MSENTTDKTKKKEEYLTSSSRPISQDLEYQQTIINNLPSQTNNKSPVLTPRTLTHLLPLWFLALPGASGETLVDEW